MSTRTTLITFVLALMSVLAAIWISRGDAAAGRGPGAMTSPLFDPGQLPVDQVDRIILERGRDAGARLVFERTETGWMQVEPFAHRMDPFSMRQLAAVAAQVQVVDRFADADHVGGLGGVEATLTLEWPGGSAAIELGRRGIAGRAYLRFAGEDEILVVNQALHERAVEMNPKEWRDRSLFKDVGVESNRIVRESGDTRLVLERDRRRWRMIEPVPTRADGEALDTYLQRLGAARASGFVADEPASLDHFGLARPLATIAVTTMRPAGDAQREETQRLHVGYQVGGSADHYCMVEGIPVVIRVPGAVLSALFADARELIDPTGTGIMPEDVKSIRILSEAGEVALERDLERWRAVSHERREVPAALVRQLLAKLCSTRASQVNIQAYPRELEAATVTLHGFDGRPLDTVRIVREPAEGVWALENGDDVLRVFPKEFDPPLKPADFGIR